MFALYARKNQLTVREREPVTSGSVNIYTARFEFSPDWSGLTKKAVFQAGKETRTVLLDKDGVCTIPWEVLADHGQSLRAGVFGTADETALPTTWASLGVILEGVSAAGAPEPAPPPVGWQEALDAKGDSLGYTYSGELGLYSGDRLLSSVPIEGGGGEDPVAREMALEAKMLAEKALVKTNELNLTTIRTDVSSLIINSQSQGFTVLSDYIIISNNDNYVETSVADVVVLSTGRTSIILNSGPSLLPEYTSTIGLFHGYSQIHKYTLNETYTLVNEDGNPPVVGEIINMKIFYGLQKEV